MTSSDRDPQMSRRKKFAWSELLSVVLFGLFAPLILMTGGSYPKDQSRTATVVMVVMSAVVYVGLIVVGLVVGLKVLGPDG